jgi:hypothetical protein
MQMAKPNTLAARSHALLAPTGRAPREVAHAYAHAHAFNAHRPGSIAKGAAITKGKIMVQSRETTSEPTPAPITDAHVIISVDDGTNGHYACVAVPSFDGMDDATRTVSAIGVKYEATRKLQSVARKAAKEPGATPESIHAAVLNAASAFKLEADSDRVETVGSRRVLVAKELTKARLAEIGKPSRDVDVDVNMPAFAAKYPDRVEAALQAYLTNGYTPSRKGEGSGSGAPGAGVDASADL